MYVFQYLCICWYVYLQVCVEVWAFWTCTVDVQQYSSSFYIPLEGQAPHEDNRGPNRAQSLNARVCHSAPGLSPSPHCSYAALCSAVSLTGKWWEVTAKDSSVLSHSLGIESPCKLAAYPQTHTCAHTLRQPDINVHRQACVHAGLRIQTLAQALVVKLMLMLIIFAQDVLWQQKLHQHFRHVGFYSYTPRTVSGKFFFRHFSAFGSKLPPHSSSSCSKLIGPRQVSPLNTQRWN